MKFPLACSASTLVGVIALAVSVSALPKITKSGRYLYDESGNRFYIKGIGYQPQGAGSVGAFGEPTDFDDPLSAGQNCTRDVSHLKDIGVNTVRVYSVNSSVSHDECMKTFSDAGIYTIIDLSLPQSSITRDSPAWSTNLQNTYLQTVQAFSKYDNVLAFNVGNEVVIAENGTAAAAFIKAAARDTKAYLQSIGSSALVGYAAVDGSTNWIVPLANYLSCDPANGNSGATAIDLYGLNNYRWCGSSSFEKSYTGTHTDFSGLSVAAYFSEYGCHPDAGTPRTWQEVSSLYSSDMSDVFSGGIAFNYFPATSAGGSFGMVTISDDGKSVQTSQDFTNLGSALKNISAPTTPSKNDAGEAKYPGCPTTSSSFLAMAKLPPTPDLNACACLEKASPCKFTPTTNNETQIEADTGTLLDYTCNALGQNGMNCDDISAKGSTGIYGNVSFCNPQQKLSYVFSLFYQNQKRDAQACNFNGAAKLTSGLSPTFPNGAAASCVASATGTSIPQISSSTPKTTGAGGSQTSGASDSPSGAAPLMASGAMLGLAVMTVVSLVGGAYTIV